MDTNSLLLIDGSYFAYRSFYAVRDMGTGGDLSKNALFGFCRDLRNMLTRCNVGKAAVVWDGGLPECRKKLLPEYKQQRPPMPDELKVQIPEIKKACAEFGVHNLRLDGEEADDLIACYAQRGKERGMRVVIATNDKDIFQVVGDGVSIYTTVKKYLNEGQRYGFMGEAEVCRAWNVSKALLIRDLLALTGDSSDNIPGVPGIGPKTAAKLVNSSGGVEDLLKDPIRHANPRIAKLITEHSENIRRNVKLVTLNTELAMPAELDDLGVKTKPELVVGYLRKQGFVSLSRDWERSVASSRRPSATPSPYLPISQDVNFLE